jgi:type IV secretory pathway VirB10-like protein
MSNSRTPVIPVVSDPELKVENAEPVEDPDVHVDQPTIGDRAKGLFTSAKSNYILVIVVVISICIIGLIAWYVVKKSKPGILDGFMKSKPKQETPPEKSRPKPSEKPSPEPIEKKPDLLDLPPVDDVQNVMREIEERRQADQQRKKEAAEQESVQPPAATDTPVASETPTEKPDESPPSSEQTPAEANKVETAYTDGMVTTAQPENTDDTPTVTTSNGMCAAFLKNGQPCKNKTKTRFCHIHSSA